MAIRNRRSHQARHHLILDPGAQPTHHGIGSEHALQIRSLDTALRLEFEKRSRPQIHIQENKALPI